MMRPKERRESGQNDLFRSRLDQILNLDHALVKLARSIDWSFLGSVANSEQRYKSQSCLSITLDLLRDFGERFRVYAASLSN